MHHIIIEDFILVLSYVIKPVSPQAAEIGVRFYIAFHIQVRYARLWGSPINEFQAERQ